MRDTEKRDNKSYPKSPKKSSGDSADNGVLARRKRWQDAIGSVSLENLVVHLGLIQENRVICPYCNKLDSLKLNEQAHTFRCSKCSKKGNSVSLLRKVKNLSNWQAITYLENLSQSERLSPQSEVKPSSNRIPEEQIERIKRDISLLDLLRRDGFSLRRQGKDWITRCPHHCDNTPSLIISPDRNLWHCLGACNEGGSVIDWVMKSRQLEFRQAVEFLREQNSFPNCSSPEIERKVPEITEVSEQRLMRRVVDYYHQCLKQNPQALAYLEQRGLKQKEFIDAFQVGFVDRTLGQKLPSGKEGREMRECLQKIGIMREGSGHEHFRGSIVFPIIGRDGMITEIYGRKIGKRFREGTPLHLYLPGPHQGIFNIHGLVGEQVILCESIIDAATWWVNGFRNVTAGYGANGLSDEIIEILVSSGIRTVYHSQDADQAGENAANIAAEKLKDRGIESFRLPLPWGIDVNEFALTHVPAGENLGILLKSARAMNGGKSRVFIEAAKENRPEVNVAARLNFPSLAADNNIKEKEATKEKNDNLPPVPPNMEVPARSTRDGVEIVIDERIYRVRGLEKNLSFDSLRVNIRVSCGEKLYIDSLDLHSARQRDAFVRNLANEIKIERDLAKFDVHRLLLKLEQLQARQIEKTLRPESKQVFISASDKERALSFLKSENLLGRIAEHIEKCGLIGERINALFCYLALISRKLQDPLAILLQALSGAGKSTLIDVNLEFVPEEDVIKYTGISGQSLFYMGEDDLVHKVLAIVEDEGAQKASYPLKIMASEKVLRMASTGKDPKSGRFVTHEYKVNGPASILLSSTAADFNDEFLSRCVLLTANDNREQTQKIHDRQRERETLKGVLADQESKELQKLHQNAQRLLRPLAVVNPYAEHLTFLDTRLRTRRDHLKYLTLIRAIALLHQYQRPIKQAKRNGKTIEYIEVTLEDIKIANELTNEVMGQNLDDLAPQTRRLLDLIEKMVKERCDRDHIKQEKCLFTRRMLREYTGWHDTEIRRHLERLTEMEYILVRKGCNGSRFFYELLYQGQGKNGKKFCMGLIDIEKLKGLH